MKNISVKKIVLCSVGAFAGLLLLIGLSFNLIAFDMGLGDQVNNALSQVGYAANGFAMMSFKFPDLLNVTLALYLNEKFMGLFAILFGVTSLLTLLTAIASVAVNVLALFLFPTEKAKKIGTALLCVGLIIAVVHSVLGIVFTSSAQTQLELFYKRLSESLGTEQEVFGGFTTSAYISVIFQVVCLVGYLVCAKKLQEKTITANAAEPAEKKAEPKEDFANKEKELQSLLNAETLVVKLLEEYKKLYDGGVLSAADYMDKKVKLLRYSDNRIKSALPNILKKCSFEGIANAEYSVIETLKEYKRLLETGVISDADFVEKKVALLGYIIR